MLRKASSTVRCPKSASALDRFGMPSDATSTGAFGSTFENFTFATTFFNRLASAVKFCAMRITPVKSTIAISRFSPAFAVMNLAAASPRSHLVPHVHRRVVEEQHHVVLLVGCVGRGIRFVGEALDRLLFVVLPHLEIFCARSLT